MWQVLKSTISLQHFSNGNSCCIADWLAWCFYNLVRWNLMQFASFSKYFILNNPINECLFRFYRFLLQVDSTILPFEKRQKMEKNKTTKLLLVHKSSFVQERKTHCNAIVLAPQQSNNNTQMAHSSVEIVIHFIQFQAGANSSSWPSRQFPIYQLFFFLLCFSSFMFYIFYKHTHFLRFRSRFYHFAKWICATRDGEIASDKEKDHCYRTTLSIEWFFAVRCWPPVRSI